MTRKQTFSQSDRQRAVVTTYTTRFHIKNNTFGSQSAVMNFSWHYE
jgi:hypothetical protein